MRSDELEILKISAWQDGQGDESQGVNAACLKMFGSSEQIHFCPVSVAYTGFEIGTLDGHPSPSCGDSTMSAFLYVLMQMRRFFYLKLSFHQANHLAMFKIYKRSIHIGGSETMQKPGAADYRISGRASSQRIPNILAIPAIIMGAIVGTMVFSLVFVALLLPLAFLGFKAWRATKNPPRPANEDSITAEYTVISDAGNKKD